MPQFKTEQEEFWAGEFGDNYIARNSGQALLQHKLYKWKKMTASINILNSCIEFGANIGLNLEVLERLFPALTRKAVEINRNACKELNKIQGVEVINSSILDYTPTQTCDLSFTSGVLNHINPNELKTVYEKLYKSSHNYILICEYYSLEPIEKTYRGHEGKLFKRDFAEELLQQYPDLKLIDYGFFYHNDPYFGDDSNWFLFKK